MLDIGKVNLVLEGISKTLIEKNKKYGNSALEPVNVFSKDTATGGIRLRLDDKVNRLRNNNKIAKNDLYDLLGYCFLLRISENSDFTDECETFPDKVRKVRNRLFTSIDQGYFNIVKVGEVFHIFKDEALEGLSEDAIEYLRGIENCLYGIKKNDVGNDDAYIWMLMKNIVAYFVVNDIINFNDLID